MLFTEVFFLHFEEIQEKNYFIVTWKGVEKGWELLKRQTHVAYACMNNGIDNMCLVFE